MWNVLFHHSENLLLPLEWTHSIKGWGNDSDMEVVARTVQVNDFYDSVRYCFEHLFFNPSRFNHLYASTLRWATPSLNLRMICLSG
jgi:hypothetical protein